MEREEVVAAGEEILVHWSDGALRLVFSLKSKFDAVGVVVVVEVVVVVVLVAVVLVLSVDDAVVELLVETLD